MEGSETPLKYSYKRNELTYCKLHDFWYAGDKCPRHRLAAMGSLKK